MKKIFITATDTDAGKTFISCAIISALTALHDKKVAAFKPVSAGCDLVNNTLVNEDAKWLTHYANCQQSIEQVNPIAFIEPIAPHIAARKVDQRITVAKVQAEFTAVTSLNADVTLVEGAGGWRLPLCMPTKEAPKAQFLADFVSKEQLDVVLIVNMKLGCLNHALLTFEAIKAQGLNCVGWIANCASSEPMNNLTDNIDSLEQLLSAPKLGQVSFITDNDSNGVSRTYQDKIALTQRKIDVTALL